MLENITRKMARRRASNLSLTEIRHFTGTPDLDPMQADIWVDGLLGYIETVYNNERKIFLEIVADYNRNRKRKFLNSYGIAVTFYTVTDDYLRFMGRSENTRKKYTLNNFNAYLKANYTEI